MQRQIKIKALKKAPKQAQLRMKNNSQTRNT